MSVENVNGAEPRIFDKEEDVMAYYQEDKEAHKVVIFEGKVYDVAEYMPDHPGGSEYIETNLGKNIEEPFEDAEHTKAAKKTLYKLPVVGIMKSKEAAGPEETKEGKYTDLLGQEFKSKFNIDYDKALLYQLFDANWTLEEYTDFINEPKILTNPVRDIKLFEHPFLEACSKARWEVVPIFWAFYGYYEYSRFIETSLPVTLVCMVLGFGFWTLMEYFLHRFFFHGEDKWMKMVPFNKFVCIFHFTIHGVHHAFPSDRLRLVFPPVPAYVLNAILAHPVITLLVPYPFFPAFYTGFLIGYVGYDLTHYYLHHGQNMPSYFRDLKIYHMQHHYKYGHIGFGVSQKIWDYAFDTVIDQESVKKLPEAIRQAQ